MNERIKELREQALRWAGENINRNLYSYYEIEQKEYEKFAELLIQKCVAISDDYVKDCTCEEHVNCKHPRSAIGKKIKEHFGVKG